MAYRPVRAPLTEATFDGQSDELHGTGVLHHIDRSPAHPLGANDAAEPQLANVVADRGPDRRWLWPDDVQARRRREKPEKGRGVIQQPRRQRRSNERAAIWGVGARRILSSVYCHGHPIPDTRAIV